MLTPKYFSFLCVCRWGVGVGCGGGGDVGCACVCVCALVFGFNRGYVSVFTGVCGGGWVCVCGWGMWGGGVWVCVIGCVGVWSMGGWVCVWVCVLNDRIQKHLETSAIKMTLSLTRIGSYCCPNCSIHLIVSYLKQTLLITLFHKYSLIYSFSHYRHIENRLRKASVRRQNIRKRVHPS